MYSNRHTEKPAHPVAAAIQLDRQSKQKLIPKHSCQREQFWLPEKL